jgi:hypothetical protein
MTIVQPASADAGDWPQQRMSHPFDYSPADVLASISEICTGWKARQFGSKFCATLRGPDFALTVWADEVHQLTARIAEVNAKGLAS